jgi:methyl-accepting chemotaxis protein
VTTNRLAKTVLAILGVWGLLAGPMLIRTLLATKQIDKRVQSITTSLSEIDEDSRSISLMQETNRLTGELLTASQPLPGTLEALRGVTSGLAGKVDSITAGVTTIEQNSREIEGKVLSARDTAAEINGSVKGIGQSLASILRTLRATQTAAGEINTSTRGINTAVVDLLPVTKEIDAGIGRANRGIVEALEHVKVIRADIGNILAGLPDVQKHSRSIDCDSTFSTLFGLLGPGEACTS